ncbi:hypothetical protein PCI56_03225 [Plesiomonas shigelloides subsp. oncorhynchi]|nr:hypothetical protein [Plesiomonas shigelloides]
MAINFSNVIVGCPDDLIDIAAQHIESINKSAFLINTTAVKKKAEAGGHL